VVDDEYMLADILAEHLREKGIDARHFRDPARSFANVCIRRRIFSFQT